MSEHKAQHQFVQTEDGSPSLATTYENGVCEKMHHFRGALSESLYIYEPALRWVFEQRSATQFHVMSLGLGLGYNELICAALATSLSLTAQTQMTTYEIDSDLKTHFVNWLTTDVDDWKPQLDQITSSLATHYSLAPGAIKQTLKSWFEQKQWILFGAFPQCLPSSQRYNVIMYDAFSRKMDEELWQEKFLTQFLCDNTQAPTAFATYASTGNLKRALRQNRFQLQPKTGFGGKKESTLAFAAMQ